MVAAALEDKEGSETKQPSKVCVPMGSNSANSRAAASIPAFSRAYGRRLHEHKNQLPRFINEPNHLQVSRQRPINPSTGAPLPICTRFVR